MAKINFPLEFSQEGLDISPADGIELPTFASDILIKLISISIHRTLNLNLIDPQSHMKAAEEKGRREALMQFASYFKNPELPK